jgi:hypothetical protein
MGLSCCAHNRSIVDTVRFIRREELTCFWSVVARGREEVVRRSAAKKIWSRRVQWAVSRKVVITPEDCVSLYDMSWHDLLIHSFMCGAEGRSAVVVMVAETSMIHDIDFN